MAKRISKKTIDKIKADVKTLEHGFPSGDLLNYTMHAIEASIDARLKDRYARGDNEPHLIVCRLIADQYNLWETTHRTDGKPNTHTGFPIWLSMIVQWRMNEMTGGDR